MRTHSRPQRVSGSASLRRRLAGLALVALTAVEVPTSTFSTLATIVTLTASQIATAQSPAQSSSGYARPSGAGGYRARTPSVGGRAWDRTPSTSAGYGRPKAPASERSGVGLPLPGSASDQAIARRSARAALDTFRARAQREEPARRPTTGLAGAWDGPRRRDWAGETAASRQDWFARSGWSPPPHTVSTTPQFGGWNAMFLWYLLDTQSRPGHTEFFHHHAGDAGYAAWRAEANQRAAEDTALRQKLAELDARLAGMREQPRVGTYLPPDTAPAVALAGGAETNRMGWGFGLLLLLVLIAVVVWFAWRHFGQRQQETESPGSPRLASDDTSSQPHWFRVGATFPIDPTPFILATGVTHVQAPEEITAGGVVSVEAVGDVTASEVRWQRSYLPGGQSFFQVHLDAQGQPDECRYFSRLDEIAPASQAEWAFWLDDTEGAIGWPEFQTKDGKVYTRVWAHGTTRVAPHVLTETRTHASGTTHLERQAMLYAAPTGAEAPIAQTEYILVAVVDQAGQAWVEIHAGIDVDAHLLQLS